MASSAMKEMLRNLMESCACVAVPARRRRQIVRVFGYTVRLMRLWCKGRGLSSSTSLLKRDVGRVNGVHRAVQVHLVYAIP